MSPVALLRPPPLTPGARVALVAPAGPLRGPEDVERGVAHVRGFGWEAVVGDHVLRREGYLAGADEERLADLNGALADDTIDGIWCLRGGYGAMRLLPHLDLASLRRRPKALLGYSDITALHAAVGLEAGLVSFHAPVARGELPPFAARSLHAAVTGAADPCGAAPEARVLRPGRAEGRLVGGNLALVAALAGTPWFPRLDGAILVLEDVGEAAYRVDRMLRQLLLGGALGGVRGLVFGHFTERPDEGDDDARPLDDVLAEVADELGVPCIAGVPMGHVDEQWTLPLGAWAALDADERCLAVPPPAATPAATPYATTFTPNAGRRPEDQMTQKSGMDLINEAKARIREVSPQEVQQMQRDEADVVYLDVREPNEWNLGRVPGAVHIPRGTLETKVEQMIPRDQEVVIYCAGGNRSALAADTLQQMGYEKVSSMAGGWRDWVQSGGQVEG
ncbi:MAG TPA: LD-carboxypeptidase [Gemmatimonadaceae bacterium]|nr:LD-carboxypeptidase [Gemmatimonadaceae bacterium]